MQILLFRHDRYHYGRWLSLKTWAWSARRTHSSPLWLTTAAGFRFKFQLFFCWKSCHLLSKWFFFTSLPAGNLRQFAHQITQLLYCPWYLLMGITIRLKNFWHLWGGLYIGQEQLRPRVVIRADSGLLSAVVLFKKTNINSKRWNSGNYHTAWKKGRCNETNYEE